MAAAVDFTVVVAEVADFTAAAVAAAPMVVGVAADFTVVVAEADRTAAITKT
jgi:hypothetical protein